MNIPESYRKSVQGRTIPRYYAGWVIRLILYLKYGLARVIARARGAQVGHSSILPFRLALKANSNLHIGEDCIIESSDFDLRSAITIGDHCIINRDVTLLRVSHIIDADFTFTTRYYSELVIEEYCWIATGSTVLPSCCHIARGTVLGAFAVLSQTDTQIIGGVFAGNPAVLLRTHDSIHTEKIVVSMKGGDFIPYIKSRK